MALFSRHLIAATLLAALSLPSFAQMPAPQPGAAAPMATQGHVVRKKQHVKRHHMRHHARRLHRAHRHAKR